MYSRIIVMSENEFKNWMYGISDEDQKLLDEMTKSK
jgi:heme/copper-type cytochrome/quinol oxidase subunit 2